mgnify:CR=1 FL=1
MNLIVGKTYLIQWTDEPEPFYADYLCTDRGFWCFKFAGKVLVCRPDHVTVIK